MSNEGTEYESTVYTNYGNRIHSCFARTDVAHSECEVKNRIKLLVPGNFVSLMHNFEMRITSIFIGA